MVKGEKVYYIPWYRFVSFLNFIFAGALVWMGVLPSLKSVSEGDLPPFDFQTLIHTYFPTVLLVSFFFVNVYCACMFLFKTLSKHSAWLHIILTIGTFIWTVLMLGGYFFSPHMAYPWVSLGTVIVIFFLLRKFSLRVALVMSLLTLVILVVTLVFGFEESYCWGKGDEAAWGTSGMTEVSWEVAKKYDQYMGGETTPGLPKYELGTAFMAHMDCHANFNFAKAIQEKYLLKKVNY